MSPLLSVEDRGNIALYSVLGRLGAEEKPASYLEIGCREGDSLLAIVSSSPALRMVVVADTWDGQYGGTGRGSHAHIERLLEQAGWVGSIGFLDGPSQETLPGLDAEFDMVLVDGDHSEDAAREDLWNAWRLLRSGGVVVFDDISNPQHPYLGPLFFDFIEAMGGEIIECSRLGVGAAAARKP